MAEQFEYVIDLTGETIDSSSFPCLTSEECVNYCKSKKHVMQNFLNRFPGVNVVQTIMTNCDNKKIQMKLTRV